MQRGEIVKSKTPRRWMAVFLVVLAVCAVALALFWTDRSNAVTLTPQDWSGALAARVGPETEVFHVIKITHA